jgi:hypothetical protein
MDNLQKNALPGGALPEVGQLAFEVFGSGRHGRYNTSRFTLRCAAAGLHGDQIHLLSVVGPETSVKALTAGLRASGKDQKRIAYSVQVGDLDVRALTTCPDGYRILRTKLDYGLWHVLCLAKSVGFMPVLTEETVWQLLRGPKYTTPLSREWMPWLLRTMKDRGIIEDLTQRGCQAGVLLADNETLDALVSEGVRTGALAIGGRSTRRLGKETSSPDKDVRTLDECMLRYGPMLGKQAERSLAPLHVPGRDPLTITELLRDPFEAQAHVIEAARKALHRQKTLLVVGECGTGKTLMGLAAAHAHAQGRPYRALVFCPGQLVGKWQREIRATIPDAETIQIDNWKGLLRLDKTQKPIHVQWYIIARDRAKLGPKWQPAFALRNRDHGFLRCPQCGLRLVDDRREPLNPGKPSQNGQAGTGLWKKRAKCEWVLTNHRGKNDPDREKGDVLTEGCGSPLWQMNGELWRYEPALFIKRHLKNFFDYLILDEIHEEKGADTAQGHAAGALAASCQKVIALTGTLIGGYAEHLRPLLFRLSPSSLVEEGLGWSNVTAFSEKYGRVETRITERSGCLGEDNRMSRGSKSTTKSVRPGIMPSLFGKHLIDKAVFLGLSEVADNLPPLEEECISIPMDAELAKAYKREVEEPLANAVKVMIRRGDRRLLGAMLQTLLAYPDYPFGWEPVGYWQAGADGARGRYVTVADPPHLPEGVIYPKELALIDLVQSEKAKRRKVWVFVQYTDKHAVQERLEMLLTQAGIKVKVLAASVPLARREDWIDEHAPHVDVVISHPRLVETGLDLFDKGGRHNFPTIAFYETGYNLFTLRQASRRAWRIGQRERCRIVYFHYEETMQERAMALMGKKLTAAQALEGTFSSEGLVALAGEGPNVELALARSLVERMDEGDARRMWRKSINTPSSVASVEIPSNDRVTLLFPIEPMPINVPFRKRRRGRALCGTAALSRACTGMLF